MTDATPKPQAQARNPLHGLTLEAIVTALFDEYGWAGLDARIPLRCFAFDPSIKSSLKFLRKAPWARKGRRAVLVHAARAAASAAFLRYRTRGCDLAARPAGQSEDRGNDEAQKC